MPTDRVRGLKAHGTRPATGYFSAPAVPPVNPLKPLKPLKPLG
jgi:hypothetical protein